jgi:hypothetical protein
MARLLTLTTMLLTLHFGGASALCQDAHDAFVYAHTDLNSLSQSVTSDIVNLHSSLSDS